MHIVSMAKKELTKEDFTETYEALRSVEKVDYITKAIVDMAVDTAIKRGYKVSVSDVVTHLRWGKKLNVSDSKGRTRLKSLIEAGVLVQPRYSRALVGRALTNEERAEEQRKSDEHAAKCAEVEAAVETVKELAGLTDEDEIFDVNADARGYKVALSPAQLRAIITAAELRGSMNK